MLDRLPARTLFMAIGAFTSGRTQQVLGSSENEY